MLPEFNKNILNRFKEISPCTDPNGFNALLLGKGSGALARTLAEACPKSHFDVVEVDKKMADDEMWYVMNGVRAVSPGQLDSGSRTNFQVGQLEIMLKTYAHQGKKFHNVVADCVSASEQNVESPCGDATFAMNLRKVLLPCGAVQQFVLPSQLDSIKATYKQAFRKPNWHVRAFQSSADPVGSIEVIGSAPSCRGGSAATIAAGIAAANVATIAAASTATTASATTANVSTATTATETTTRENILRKIFDQFSERGNALFSNQSELATATKPSSIACKETCPDEYPAEKRQECAAFLAMGPALLNDPNIAVRGEACKSTGCCWQPLEENIAGPWCYVRPCI